MSLAIVLCTEYSGSPMKASRLLAGYAIIPQLGEEAFQSLHSPGVVPLQVYLEGHPKLARRTDR